MKVKPGHYDLMHKAMAQTKADNPEKTPAHYAANGRGKDTAKRHRWDCLYASRIGDGPVSRWICDNLYSYMDDSHLDTALRRIQRELWPE
jgi:hypothetical protein